ncbi:MAG: hypothetical protein LAP21_25135 [Acidobacteriia bacterium]|nr:hypothetical protein [Terriglobia bacterium]
MASTGLGLGTQTATDPQAQIKYTLAVALANIKRSASWFDWIAGLSVVNAIITMANGTLQFVVGLGVTVVINGIAAKGGNTGRAMGFIITLVAAGFFVLMGHFAKQGQKWALIIGIVFYGLDAALVLLFQDWLMLAFHAYALFMLCKAFPAINAFEQVKQQAATQGVML